MSAFLTRDMRPSTSACADKAEISRWTEVLERLLDAVLFLAKQNLAFQGHRKALDGAANAGNFLELVKLIAKYDPVMREHLASVAFQLNPQHRTCLRKSKMMTNHVRTEIIKGVKAAKYFAALFDSTPDISHTDQFTQILHYVKIQDGSVEVKESFVDFIAQCQRRPVPYRCYFVKDYC